MEASPLTQQSRPETFKPKIVQLYETLFKVCPSTCILSASQPILILGSRSPKKMMWSPQKASGGSSFFCPQIGPGCIHCWMG